jgi:hypothetical protein
MKLDKARTLVMLTLQSKDQRISGGEIEGTVLQEKFPARFVPKSTQ